MRNIFSTWDKQFDVQGHRSVQFMSPVQQPFHPAIMSTPAQSYGTETYTSTTAPLLTPCGNCAIADFFSANTKIWLDFTLSIVEIKAGLHLYIITSLRLSIWLSVSSQYKSRLRIIEARPFIRAQDRILNSDAITLESLRPNLELLARHSFTISLSATGSQ